VATIVHCPFYKKNKGMKTYCEGGAVNHPDKIARREYMAQFCADLNNWHRCSIAEAMEKYYERED